MSEDEQKIFVDSDWKKEAQQEKDRLAEQEAEAHPEAFPEASFMEIINMISMQAAIGLGGFKTPDGRVIPPDIHAAKHHIDLLEVLLKKTESNLEEQETAALTATLHELRLLFVQIAAGGVAPPDAADDAAGASPA